MNLGIPRKTSAATNKGGFSTGTKRGVQSGVLGYPAAISATGGTTVTTVGNIRYHQFNTSGNFTVGTSGGKIEVLIVSGGGAGGTSSYDGIPGGGGGASVQVFQLNVVSKEIVTVVIGAGAAAATYLQQPGIGSPSSIVGTFGTYSLPGGGSAASVFDQGAKPAFDANNLGGACGGGVGAQGSLNYKSGGGGGGMGTTGFDAGGTLATSTVSPSKGFRGGAASSNIVGGVGGDGISVWGNYYGGGGGGGSQDQTVAALGGLGGGGISGIRTARTGGAGTVNTGGGGGGANSINPWPGTQSTAFGGTGGSGVVIFRYAI